MTDRECRPPEGTEAGTYWWLKPVDEPESPSPWLWTGKEFEGKDGGIVPEQHGQWWEILGPCLQPEGGEHG